jgi:hypothetical protein
MFGFQKGGGANRIEVISESQYHNACDIIYKLQSFHIALFPYLG